MRRPVLFIVLLSLPLATCSPAAAQAPRPTAPGFGFEITSTERWLHSRQSSAFTPWSEPDIRHWLHVDSIARRPTAGTRELRISRNFPNDGTHLHLVQDSAGQVLSLDTTIPSPAVIAGQEYFDAMALLTRSRPADFGRPAGFGTFQVDAQELLPTFNPPQLTVGAAWTDSVHLDNADGDGRFLLTGRRHSRIVGDTLIDGRPYWIVRDSAAVVLSESWTRAERTLDTMVVHERRGEGTIAGRYVHDPSVDLFISREDTIRLAGDVALHYPDGRTFRVPARYERHRSWLRYEAAAAAARREETLEAMMSRRSGMLRLPADELETRLRAGDGALVDSLVEVWHRSRDPAERRRLRGLISMGRPADRSFETRLNELALEAGDTAAVLRQVQSTPSADRPLRVVDLERLLPLLRDPAVALAFGVESDFLYGGLRESLLRAPPAVFPDLASLPCEPQACRLLAAQSESEGDPRLRDLGLIARFALDPRGGEAAILRREQEGSAMVRPAAQLLRGVGATWALAAQLPLPREDAPWRDWLAWMGGTRTDLPAPPSTLPANSLRFESSHRLAILFFEARTGRPVVQELHRRHDTAPSDSARLVFGTILHGLGELRATPGDLARSLATGSEAERTLALRELPGALRNAPPAGDSLAAILIDRLLSVVVDGAEPWPLHPSPPDPSAHRSLGQVPSQSPVFVLADDLPAGLRGSWRERVELISGEEWEARSPRLAALFIRPGAVVQSGPLVRLSLAYETRDSRREDQSPAGGAGGFDVVLLQTPTGWVVVSESRWVT